DRMRALLIVLSVAGVAASSVSAQNQITLTLNWDVDVPNVTSFLNAADTTAWQTRQNDLYLPHLKKHLPFWLFHAGQGGMETITISLKPVGSVKPALQATAEIQLKGMDVPATIWDHELMTADELASRV